MPPAPHWPVFIAQARTDRGPGAGSLRRRSSPSLRSPAEAWRLVRLGAPFRKQVQVFDALVVRGYVPRAHVT